MRLMVLETVSSYCVATKPGRADG